MRKYNNNKPKNMIPNMEDADPDIWYAITLNPAKQYDVRRLNQQYRRLNKIYKVDAKIYSLRLYPELSQIGRLHFHGYIKISKVFQFYYTVIRKLLEDYTIVIKEITDENWDVYCRKQQKLFITDLGYEYSFPLVFNHQPRKLPKDFKKLLAMANKSEAVGSPETLISPQID